MWHSAGKLLGSHATWLCLTQIIMAVNPASHADFLLPAASARKLRNRSWLKGGQMRLIHVLPGFETRRLQVLKGVIQSEWLKRRDSAADSSADVALDRGISQSLTITVNSLRRNSL